MKRKTLPESVPARTTADLAKEKLPARPSSLYRLLMESIEEFVRINPSEAEGVLEGCKEIVDRYRPLKTQLTLKVKDAARITGLSEPRIYQLADEGVIGTKVGGTRWRFSEKELHEFKIKYFQDKSGSSTS